MIYHVISNAGWQKALSEGFYEADSLAKEGFIHASKEDQVAGVIQRFYKDKTDLILLHIDENKLTAELKYELAPSINEEFPHIFGPLNTDAVVKTSTL